MMSAALRQAKGRTSQAPVDEQSVSQAHQAAYGGGDSGSLDASGMGSAAAMKVNFATLSNSPSTDNVGRPFRRLWLVEAEEVT